MMGEWLKIQQLGNSLLHKSHSFDTPDFNYGEFARFKNEWSLMILEKLEKVKVDG